MMHITEEEMVDGYYTGAAAEWGSHLESCAECRALYGRICETLEIASEARAPERGAGYGAEVWARVSAELEVKRGIWKVWMLVPALAGLGAIAFLIWNQRGIPQAPVVPVRPVAIAVSPVRVVKQAPVPKRVTTPHPHKAVVSDQQLLVLNSRLETDDKSALPELLQVIQGDAPDKTKEHALFVLAQSDSVGAHEVLVSFAAQSSDTVLQKKAVRMMELRNSARSYLPLTEMPKTDKKQILASVFMASDSQVLENILKRERNPDVRAATVRSLAVMGERSQVLVNIYRVDSDEKVRRAVLDALVVQQNSDALSELARGEADAVRKAEILSRIATIRK